MLNTVCRGMAELHPPLVEFGMPRVAVFWPLMVPLPSQSQARVVPERRG